MLYQLSYATEQEFDDETGVTVRSEQPRQSRKKAPERFVETMMVAGSSRFIDDRLRLPHQRRDIADRDRIAIVPFFRSSRLSR